MHNSAHNWDTVGADVAAQLTRLIQFKTVNPPGDERLLAEYLQHTLDGAGIPTTWWDITPTRAAVMGRIAGRGDQPPVMLVAHTDVVDVEPSQWSVDPFAGTIRNGYVYGRGAIDDKGMLAANLVVMLLLQQDVQAGRASFARDILFLATPDEEAGGAMGMGWMTEHEEDLLRSVQYAINEGGRIRIGPDGTRTLLLQNAEKVSHIITITANGPAGHAGVPRPDNAILCLARALDRIAAYAGDPVHGVSPTLLQSGSKYNVIPAAATATLNIRTRPSESIDDIVAHLRALIDDSKVTVEITERGDGAPASPEDSPMFAAIAAAARTLDPEILVQPYLSNGITDSARLRRLGVHAYGILPFPLTPDDEARMHGHDERVPVASLQFGTRLLYEAVRAIAAG